MSEIGPKTVRTEQYEFEARTTDPSNTEPGEYWIRTDQTSSDPQVVAELRRQDNSGVTKIPLFDASEESNLGSDVVRGPSVVLDDGTVGFIAQTTDSGAKFGSPRVVTASGAEYLSHDSLTLPTIPDSVVLQLDAREANTGETTTLTDQLPNSDEDLSMSGSAEVITSGINGQQTYQFDSSDSASVTANDSIAVAGSDEPYGYFFVFELRRGEYSGQVDFVSSNGGVFDMGLQDDSGSYRALANNAGAGSSGSTDSSVHLGVLEMVGGGGIELYIDGTKKIDTGLSSNDTINSIELSGGPNSGAAMNVGQFEMAVGYSASERDSITSRLKSDWGLTY